MLSCFAIVILSIIGALFKVGTAIQGSLDSLDSLCHKVRLSLTNMHVQSNHHMMMGLEEDPEDSGAVAAAIFIAVGVYGVSIPPKAVQPIGLTISVVFPVLRTAGIFTYAGESTRRYILTMITQQGYHNYYAQAFGTR